LIEVSFNELLFHHAWLLHQIGIPVVAGAPCVSRLSDLQLGIECVWFHLSGAVTAPSYTVVGIDINDPAQARYIQPHSMITGPLTSSELTDLMSDRGRVMHWSEALDIIEETRKVMRESVYTFRTPYGTQFRYEPFYLALFERE
jgi:hypothetical protein